MISTVTLNPALDITLTIPELLPGRLNRAVAVHRASSGKGINVSIMLHRLGVKNAALCLLGGATGAFIKQELEQMGLSLSVVPVEEETRCNVKVLESKTGVMTELNSPGPPPADWRQVHARLAALAGPGVTVVLSGSLPAGAAPDTYRRLAALAGKQGARSVVDAAGEVLREALCIRPFLVKPNRLEAAELLGTAVETEAEEAAAAIKIQKAGAENVLLSLGAKGAVLAAGRAVYRSRPPVVKAHSTAGCGDALLAGVLAGLARGWSWRRSLRWGTAAASAAAALPGTAFPDALTVEDYTARVETWRLT